MTSDAEKMHNCTSSSYNEPAVTRQVLTSPSHEAHTVKVYYVLPVGAKENFYVERA